jgi:type I site-specific restriction endonuclease
VKKHSIAIKIFLLLVLSAAVAIVYGVRGLHDARVHREAACYHANIEKLNSLEPSTATVNTELEEIQRDQDVIDQLDGTDDETVIQRRSRMIDGVRLKLTKVNKDRAEGQRRTEQIQAELSGCLEEVK